MTVELSRIEVLYDVTYKGQYYMIVDDTIIPDNEGWYLDPESDHYKEVWDYFQKNRKEDIKIVKRKNKSKGTTS